VRMILLPGFTPSRSSQRADNGIANESQPEDGAFREL
jgi:hypothetical protein